MHRDDKRAPMASAPMRYLPDGGVDWGAVWDAFCVLALDGGPPHRGSLLQAPAASDVESEGYRFAADTIVRGIDTTSHLPAEPSDPGWIAVRCRSSEQARWLATAIRHENVEARTEETPLFVPAGDDFGLEGEIKNAITAVAKTTFYWEMASRLPTPR